MKYVIVVSDSYYPSVYVLSCPIQVGKVLDMLNNGHTSYGEEKKPVDAAVDSFVVDDTTLRTVDWHNISCYEGGEEIDFL